MRWIYSKNHCAVIAVSLLLVFILLPSSSQAKRPIRVGIEDCYSGPPAAYTNDALAAFKIALAEINKKGVLGRKIEFTTRDDKFKVDIGLSNAKELIMRENVDLLIGGINSAVILAISEYCKNERVPFLTWAPASHKVTGEKGHRYVFDLATNTAQNGAAGAVGLAKKPYVNYWIAGDDYEYGHAIASGCWSNLKKLKPEVKLLGQSWWKVGEPDFTPYITAILNARPDAVIVATGGRDMATFMKAAKATGMSEKVAIWIHTAIDHTSVSPLGLEAPEGVLGTSNYLFYYPDSPANKQFVDVFHKTCGRYPGFYALAGYITAKFIAEGFERAGALDMEKFIDALEGMSIDSPTGRVRIRAYDHQIIQPVFMGVTSYVPQYNFVIAKDIVELPGEQITPSVEEIKRARGK
jgi:branched-chain amino acid transport system substrate-binding protein